DEVFEERIDALLEDREGAAAAVEAQRFARIGEGLAERGFGSGGADEAVDLAMEAHRRVSEGDGGPAGEP
ncbi:MAG: hypothetical protein ACRDX8_13120, partial [Acidimicrobiales bacterium]